VLPEFLVFFSLAMFTSIGISKPAGWISPASRLEAAQIFESVTSRINPRLPPQPLASSLHRLRQWLRCRLLTAELISCDVAWRLFRFAPGPASARGRGKVFTALRAASSQG